MRVVLLVVFKRGNAQRYQLERKSQSADAASKLNHSGTPVFDNEVADGLKGAFTETPGTIEVQVHRAIGHGFVVVNGDCDALHRAVGADG